MKLLCVGDIHLGRQPSRLTDALFESLSARDLSPATAWRASVDEALRLEVDAVLLAGDVVEQNNDFYEAYADLQAGIERLHQANIKVLGVAGNHDVEVLPRLADNLPEFILLGRNGKWQSHTLEAADGSQVDVLGWSFPTRLVTNSPLAGGLPGRNTRCTIGLLHCDRDQSGSRYAPVSSAELEAADVDAWLLGHIHKPDALSSSRPIGYLGSLSGLSPKDKGARGPWLLNVGPDGQTDIKQLPLTPLRWEEIDISLDALDRAEDIHSAIIAALRERHELIRESEYQPRAVGCRLLLTGRTALRRQIEAQLRDTDPRANTQQFDSSIWFIHDWRMQAAPAIDLHELSRSGDPAGLLARKLLLLQAEDNDARRDLIRTAQRQMTAVTNKRHFAALQADTIDESRTAELLESAALSALDRLLAQREEQS